MCRPSRPPVVPAIGPVLTVCCRDTGGRGPARPVHRTHRSCRSSLRRRRGTLRTVSFRLLRREDSSLGVQPELQVAPGGPAGLLPKPGGDGSDFVVLGRSVLMSRRLHNMDTYRGYGSRGFPRLSCGFPTPVGQNARARLFAAPRNSAPGTGFASACEAARLGASPIWTTGRKLP